MGSSAASGIGTALGAGLGYAVSPERATGLELLKTVGLGSQLGNLAGGVTGGLFSGPPGPSVLPGALPPMSSLGNPALSRPPSLQQGNFSPGGSVLGNIPQRPWVV